ncbi:YfcE family phosphodiesterase [Candidatus Fermentibacterales bacterium]|nr:YfcE family phosphodiesterase [Candidatus Fermentibacterales bacterium]
MRIAVLADTHVPSRLGSVQGRVYEECADSDLILHAGDLVEADVLRDLERFADVRAVRGNMDDASLQNALPDKQIFELEGFRIGLTHGSGAPLGITSRVLRTFGGQELDIIIHGHSHHYSLQRMDDLMILNPGAVVDRSFAVLTLQSGEEPQVEHITF